MHISRVLLSLKNLLTVLKTWYKLDNILKKWYTLCEKISKSVRKLTCYTIIYTRNIVFIWKLYMCFQTLDLMVILLYICTQCNKHVIATEINLNEIFNLVFSWCFVYVLLFCKSVLYSGSAASNTLKMETLQVEHHF